MIKLFVKSEH